MATTVIRTCDLCGTVIDPKEVYLNAGAYGREAHINCFRILTPIEVLGFLDLDDINEMRGDDWATADKLVHVEAEARTWKERIEKRRADLNRSITL